jgi:hypothetical protein
MILWDLDKIVNHSIRGAMIKNLLLILSAGFVLVSKSTVRGSNEVYARPNAGHNGILRTLQYGHVLLAFINGLLHHCNLYLKIRKTRDSMYMDLPNLTIAPKGFFVGASDLPFSLPGW